MAIAHSIWILIYHLLQRGRPTKTSAISTSRSTTATPWSAASLEARSLSYRVTLELVAAWRLLLEHLTGHDRLSRTIIRST